MAAVVEEPPLLVCHIAVESSYSLVIVLVIDWSTACLHAVVEEPPLYVCHIAVEMAPICKVGGLGDVVTSLGRAVQEQGHQVEVVLPRWVGDSPW